MKRASSGGWGLWTLLLVVGGILTSVLVSVVVAHSDSAKSHEAFRESSDQIASTLGLAIQHEQDLVISSSAFVADDPSASNRRFGQWVGTVQALQRYPEILALGHAVVVPASRLSAFAHVAVR